MKLKELSREKIKHIERIVKAIRNSGVQIDPFKIAEMYGIPVRFIHTYNVPAFTIPSFNEVGKFIIFISNSVDKYSARILLYHELGHILCESHPAVHLFDHTIDHEAEFTANYFAAGFLPIFSRMKITENTTLEEINSYVSTLIIPKGDREIDVI